MRGPRVDATLSAPPAPRSVPVLDNLEGVLALPGPAGPGPFLVEAGMVRVTGRERGGIDSVSIAGQRIVAALSASTGSVANVVSTPSSLRREILGPTGAIQETILTPETQPAAAIQWKGAPAHEQGLVIRFVMAPGSTDLRYRVTEYALVVRTTGSTDDHVVFIHPPPHAWTAVGAEGGGLAVTAEAKAGSDEAVSMAVVALPQGGAGGTALLHHLASHQIRARSAPWDEGGVRLATGVSQIDEGMGWLAARLRSCLGTGTTSATDLVWWGLGSLACGLPPAADRAFHLLNEGHGARPQTILLAARIASVTGNQQPARQVAAGLLSQWDDSKRPDDPLTAAAWTALADALRHAAPDEDIASLRRAASLPATSPGGVTLPMAGGAQRRAHLPLWLTRLIERTESEDGGLRTMSEAATAIRGLSSDEADAYSSWRTLVASGLSGGPMGRGTWDSPETAGAPVAGALVCGMLHGLLGWDPDAPVGRLGLSPSFPPHLTSFAVEGLTVGDARVRMEYQREGRDHTYTFEPTAGRVPPTLVLKPRLVAKSVPAVHVDGQIAEVDVAIARDRAGVSVQIPLDGPRILRLTTQGEG